MDEKRFEDKLDKVMEHISNIDITLAKQSVVLDEHVKRTNLLEAKVEPIEKHVHMIQGGLKLLGLAALFIGLIEGLVKLMGLK